MTHKRPRPRWHHQQVKELAAQEIIEDVNHWAQLADLENFASNSKEFLALVTVALIESADSYNASRYLEDFYKWPSDRKLVSILDRAYFRMPQISKNLEREWVLETGERFPAKKNQGIVARIGGTEVSAVVVSVIQEEARGLVTILGSNNSKYFSVLSEDVVTVVKSSVKTPTGDDAA